MSKMGKRLIRAAANAIEEALAARTSGKLISLTLSQIAALSS